jgi:hypothetical protein
MMNSPNYFYRDAANREIGPLPLPALAQLRQAGILSDDTPVRGEDDKEWTHCRNVIAVGLAAGPVVASVETTSEIATAEKAETWRHTKKHYVIGGLAALLLFGVWLMPLMIKKGGKQPMNSQPWENTLGMKFEPVPGTGMLFCIWETRVQDYEVFVDATGYDAAKGMYSIRDKRPGPHGDTWRSPGFPQGPTNPVNGVSWDDAKAFCRWLTDKEQKEGRLGPKQEYRLPTDAEWSMAVGLDESVGGTPKSKSIMIKSVYPWGTQWPPPRGAGNFADETAAKSGRYSESLPTIAGYDDGYEATAPVGSFQPNKYGLYDLAGNVWEWCEDYYNGSGGERVARGGSFLNANADALLSSCRFDSGSDFRMIQFGFRCVVVVSIPGAAVETGAGGDDAIQRESITKNLRMLAAARDQFFIEHGVAIGTYTQVAGNLRPGGLKSVAGEDYRIAELRLGQPLSVRTSDGRVVTYPTP